MPKILKYICWYYVLVFVVGIVQLTWIIKFRYSDTFLVFGMSVNMVVVIILLIAWILRRRIILLWFIVFDSVISIFSNLYLCYEILYPLFEHYSRERFLFHINYYGVYYGWNGILTLIGIVILVYVVKNFSELSKPNEIDAPEAHQDEE